MTIRGHWGGVENFFLIGQNRLNPTFRQACAVCASARTSKFSFSKYSRGLKYKYFFVKIGMKLPFTIKNKRRNTILKFEYYFIFTPKKARFWFLKKNTKKKCFSCFSSDSALKTINTQLLLLEKKYRF